MNDGEQRVVRAQAAFERARAALDREVAALGVELDGLGSARDRTPVAAEAEPPGPATHGLSPEGVRGYVLDLCDEHLCETSLRAHRLRRLGGAGRRARGVPVDAYYPRNRVAVLFRDRRGREERALSGMVAVADLTLVVLTPDVLVGAPRNGDGPSRSRAADLAGVAAAVGSARARGARAPARPAGYATPSMELSQGENVIYSGHPSWRGVLSFYVKGLAIAVLAAAVAALVSAIAGDGVSVAWVILVLVVVFGLVVLAGFVYRTSTTFMITSQRLYIRRGIFSRRVQQTRLERVQNVNTEQSPLDRVLHVGQVDFDTAGSEDSDFTFRGVAGPEEIVHAVDKAQREYREALLAQQRDVGLTPGVDGL